MHRLPIHDTARAAALRVALGCEIEPRAHRDADHGTESALWNVSTKTGEAGQILEQWSQGMMAPGHPFHAAWLGIQAAQTLRQWLRQPHAVPATIRHAGRLVGFEAGLISNIGAEGEFQEETIELRSPEESSRLEGLAMAQTFSANRPFPFMAHHFAAAAIVAGCLPLALSGSAQVPVLHLTAVSVTWPGVKIDDLANAVLGGVGVNLALGGAAPGEHPFFYAWEAIRTFAGYRYAETIAAKNPVHYYRGEGHGNPHSALVSEAVLKNKKPILNGKTAEDLVTEHVAGC